MARKPIHEFTASDGTNVAPDPVDTGVSARAADVDRSKGETEIPPFAGRAEAMQAMMSLMSGFPVDAITDIYKGLAGTIVPKGGARPGDKQDGETGIIVLSPTAVGGMTNEDVADLFKGENLSEELLTKAKTIFEAAVGARVIAETARIQEDADTKLTEAVEQAIETLTKRVDDYITYAALEFVNENKLAIEEGVRQDISETFFGGLKKLFIENYVDVPEDKLDAMAQLVDRIDQLETDYNGVVAENLSLKGRVSTHETGEAISEATKDMTLVDAEKLKKLVEGVSYANPGELKQKIGILKEAMLKPATGTSQVRQLNETVEGGIDTPTDETAGMSPEMKAYTAALTRTMR